MSFELTLPASEVSRLRSLQALGILRLRRRRLARSRRGTHEACGHRRFASRDLSHHGGRSIPRTLERACTHPRYIAHSGRRAASTTFDRLGRPAGCLWAVANTMTIFAIRDIGLSGCFSPMATALKCIDPPPSD